MDGRIDVERASGGRFGADPMQALASFDALRDWAAAHPGATPAQVSLGWLLARPTVSSVVIGARTVEQLRANLAATELKFAPEEIAALTAASAVRLPYPARAVNLEAR